MSNFEVQTALYNALENSTNFMDLIQSLSDKPSDNQNYPYVCLEEENELPANRHQYLGKQMFFSFGIYTKTGQLGTYIAKKIYNEMNTVLDMKKFILETSTLKMRICKLFNYEEFQNSDIIGAFVTYEVILHDTVENVY